MAPTDPAEVQLQQLKILQSGVSILWSHYSFEAAKLKKWSSEPGGEDLIPEAKTAQYLATRFKSTLTQLNEELDELLRQNFNQWQTKANDLSTQLNAATQDVNKHYKELQSMEKTTQTGAEVLASILEVLKFLALIP